MSVIDAGFDIRLSEVEAGSSFLVNGVQRRQNGDCAVVRGVWGKALFQREN